MINRSSRRWELVRAFTIIFTIYFLHIALNELILLSVSVLFPRSIEGGPGLIFSFTGFLSRLFTLFSFLSAVLIGERIVFKEKLLAIESYSIPISVSNSKPNPKPNSSASPSQHEHKESAKTIVPAPRPHRQLRKPGGDILCGLMLGMSLFTLLFLVFKGIGWLTVTDFLFSVALETPSSVYLQIFWSIPVLLVSAVFEELFARGFLLSVCKKICGTAGGIFLSALFFSLMHFYNPHFSAAGLIGILLAGLWFGLAYELTGALYLSTATHFSWNISQMLLGFPVSGLDTPHLVMTKISGPKVWTGGEFGPEAGISGYLLIILGIVLVLVYAKKRMLTKDYLKIFS